MYPCLLLFVVTQQTSPPPIEGKLLAMYLLFYMDVFWLSDERCPENQNNCSNISYCYVYSVTNQSYCAQSCELNNGGCGTDWCVMVTVQCFTAPCPPVVNCRPSSKFLTMKLFSYIYWPCMHVFYFHG